ncbi:MAG TPA: RDD family protein [Bryobacteraceae bacterium]|nr:RDD family protein [Bryobacteraceae bacterium]
MECGYCRYGNPEGAHRCARCGRPFPAPVRSVRLRGGQAAAAVAAPVPLDAPKSATRYRRRRAVPQQQWLFEELRPRIPSGTKVIPFDALAGGPPASKPGPRARAPRRLARENVPLQQALDFLPELPPAPRLRSGVPVSVNCEAPVAPVEARLQAALLDLAVGVSAWAVFAAIVLTGTEGGAPRAPTAGALGAAFGLIFLFYKLLAAFSGASCGMRWTHLAWVDFDGRPLALPQRLGRLAAGAVSVLPAGFGLLWVLLNEERLGFHDHISKSFVTRRR